MVRSVTANLIEAVGFDTWPRMAAIVDFGLKSQQHYEALYYPIRNGEVTAEQLDAALGDGKKLTELVAKLPSNPHKGIVFKTDYDDMPPEDDGEE